MNCTQPKNRTHSHIYIYRFSSIIENLLWYYIYYLYYQNKAYTWLITILLNQLPLRKDINSSESRKRHTHSTKLTTVPNAHIYSKMDFALLMNKDLWKECRRETLAKENEDMSDFLFFSLQKETLATQLSSKELVLEFYGFSIYLIHLSCIHNTYCLINAVKETRPWKGFRSFK